MITITAIIKAKPGHADDLQAALLEVSAYVDAHEPDTVSFFLSRDIEDDHVFTTYERFTSIGARDRHNGSPATLEFFEVAQPIIEKPVILHSCQEFSEKARA